jgi:DNA-binding transcriptional regulator LsrR (DeoR family)
VNVSTRSALHDQSDLQLVIQVANLYHVQKLTQAEVAKRLGLSATKVHRLLKQASDQGVVEITVRTPIQRLSDLENRLEAIFGLHDAVVIPQVPEDPSAFVYTLGRAGASYLVDHLRDGDVIGISGGTGVNSVVQALEASRDYDVAVVPLVGAVQGRVTTDVNYLSTELAGRLGGRAYQLHAPADVDTREQRDMLLSMRPIKGILDIARKASIVLMGVGEVDAQPSRFAEFTSLSAEDLTRIAADCEGVGQVLGIFYNAQGKPCAPEYEHRVVGLTLQELRRVPLIIGVAATAVKIAPLYGALRGCYLNSLITDEAAARGIIELFERDFHWKGG